MITYEDFVRIASDHNRVVGISKEQYEHYLTQRCYCCGTDERVGLGLRRPLGPYDFDNVFPACVICVVMQGQMSLVDFLEHARKITLSRANYSALR